MSETIFDIKRQLVRKRKGDPDGPWDKFYEYLVAEASVTLPNRPNWEVIALVSMVQLAFDGSGAGKPVTVSPYLVHNLAAFTVLELLHNESEPYNWTGQDIPERIFTGFTKTVIHHIQTKQTHTLEGETYVGGLLVPGWFVAWAQKIAAKV